MSEKQPTSIFVIAVLHLVVGSVGVLWIGFNTLTVFAERPLAKRFFTDGQQQELAEVAQSLPQQAPFFRTYQVVGTVAVPWLLTLALLVGGLGLIRLRSWGRSISLAYAVISILHKIVLGVYTVVFLLPVYQAPAGNIRVLDPDALVVAETTTFLTLLGVPFLLMIYPVVVLLVMYQPAVIAAFRPRFAPVPQPT